EPAAPEHAPSNAVAPWLIPFLVLLAAGMVSRALSRPGWEPLALLRPLAGALALAAYARTLAPLAVRPSRFAAPAGLVVAGVWLALEAIARVKTSAHPDLRPAWLALRALAAVSVVPIIEELAFRGFLARRLSSREFDTLAPERITMPAVLGSALA